MNAKLFTLTLFLFTLTAHYETYTAAQEAAAAPQPLTYDQKIALYQQQVFEGIDQKNAQLLDAALATLHALSTNANQTPDFNFRNKDGATPLHVATMRDDAGHACMSVLGYKADPEARHTNGSGTPLLTAIKCCAMGPLLALLNGKANVEANDDYGTPALEIALNMDSVAPALSLIDYGANHMRKNKANLTLFDAIDPKAGHKDIIQKKIIAHHGPKLFAAIKENNKETFTATLALLPTAEFTNEQGETPLLHVAAMPDNGTFVYPLLQKKADVNTRHPNGYDTPLLIALKQPHNAHSWILVSALLSAKAHIEGVNKNGKTALMLAVEQLPADNNPSSLNILNTLIQRDATNAARDGEGNNALLYAVCKNDIRAADALLNYAERNCMFDLQNGARKHINHTNDEGDSALSLAIKNGNSPAMVRLLVAAGASTYVKTSADRSLYAVDESADALADVVATPYLNSVTVFDIATPEMQQVIREAQNEYLIDSEKTRIARAQFMLRKGIQTGDLELVDSALADGADIHYTAKIHHPDQPLVEACKPPVIKAHPHMIQALLDRKANINHIDQSTGLTPLMHTIKHGCPEATEALLALGADVRTISRTTALHIAMIEKKIPLARQLIDLNAPIDAQSFPSATHYYSKGDTPLQLALHLRQNELIAPLILAKADVNAIDGQHHTCLARAQALDTQQKNTVLMDLINAALKKRTEIEGQAILDRLRAREAEASPAAKASEDKSPVRDEEKDRETDNESHSEDRDEAKNNWLWVD